MSPSLREQLVMDQALKGIRKELLEKAIRATSAGNLKSMIEEFYAVEIHEKVSGPRTPQRNFEIRGPNTVKNDSRTRNSSPSLKRVRWDPFVKSLEVVKTPESDMRNLEKEPENAKTPSLEQVRQIIRADTADVTREVTDVRDHVDTSLLKLSESLQELTHLFRNSANFAQNSNAGNRYSNPVSQERTASNPPLPKPGGTPRRKGYPLAKDSALIAVNLAILRGIVIRESLVKALIR